MASTRNKNTPGDFCLQQRQYNNSSSYTTFINSSYGSAYTTRMPGLGFNPAQMPMNKLSYNAADTESFLFGINATNLVNPAPIFVPEIAKLSSINVFENENHTTFIPEPLTIEKSQRPLPN